MTDYRRCRVAGGTYFFTVIGGSKRGIVNGTVDPLRNAFREVKKAHSFQLDAIVIMPEHLHTIWTLPEGDDDFSLRWRQITSAFSRQIETSERITKSRSRKQERGIYPRAQVAKAVLGTCYS